MERDCGAKIKTSALAAADSHKTKKLPPKATF
jgi:hypothetical protein